jgi:hypothetical protein
MNKLILLEVIFMKRSISVVLSVIMLFCFFSVSFASSGTHTQNMPWTRSGSQYTTTYDNYYNNSSLVTDTGNIKFNWSKYTADGSYAPIVKVYIRKSSNPLTSVYLGTFNMNGSTGSVTISNQYRGWLKVTIDANGYSSGLLKSTYYIP